MFFYNDFLFGCWQLHGAHGAQVWGTLRAVRGPARRVPLVLLLARHGLLRRRRRLLGAHQGRHETDAGEEHIYERWMDDESKKYPRTNVIGGVVYARVSKAVIQNTGDRRITR